MDRRDFYMEKVFHGWDLPVFCLDRDDAVLSQPADQETMVNPAAAEMIRADSERTGRPVIRFESGRIFFMGFIDHQEHLYLIGPASIGRISEEEVLAYRHRSDQSVKTITGIRLQQALSCLSMLYEALTGKMVSEAQIAGWSGIDPEGSGGKTDGYETGAAWYLELFEKNMAFFTAEDEKRFIAEFRTGQMRISDEIIIRDLWELEMTGPMARENYLKLCEYIVVTAGTLMRTTAIEEGVPGETAFRIYNHALSELTRASTVLDMMYVYQAIVNQFGEEILKVRQKKSEDVLPARCRDYVAKHIRTHFTIGEMARDLGYNASYLSRTFSQKTGKTLQQYITSERLRRTAALLKYSDEKIGTISESMGYSSQKRMAEQFEKFYGMTPSAYRKQNRSNKR